LLREMEAAMQIIDEHKTTICLIMKETSSHLQFLNNQNIMTIKRYISGIYLAELSFYLMGRLQMLSDKIVYQGREDSTR
jgi:hypothetical protein